MREAGDRYRQEVRYGYEAIGWDLKKRVDQQSISSERTRPDLEDSPLRCEVFLVYGALEALREGES